MSTTNRRKFLISYSPLSEHFVNTIVNDREELLHLIDYALSCLTYSELQKMQKSLDEYATLAKEDGNL